MDWGVAIHPQFPAFTKRMEIDRLKDTINVLSKKLALIEKS